METILARNSGKTLQNIEPPEGMQQFLQMMKEQQEKQSADPASPQVNMLMQIVQNLQQWMKQPVALSSTEAAMATSAIQPPKQATMTFSEDIAPKPAEPVLHRNPTATMPTQMSMKM